METYLDIYIEELRHVTSHLSQDDRWSVQDSIVFGDTSNLDLLQ
jgi:hypothetical protein